MSVVKLFFKDENIDVKSEIIDKHLTAVDDKIKNNPSFISQLYEAVRALIMRKNYGDPIPPIELYVSEDGKTIELRTAIVKDPQNVRPELENNKHFRMAKFSTDGKTNPGGMDVTFFTGTLVRYEDFMKAYAGTEVEEKYKYAGRDPQMVQTVLSVYHTHRGFLESGVEVCRSTYSDHSPLGLSMDNDEELKTQTVYCHAPKNWYFNLEPDEAMYECHPYKTHAFRYSKELGVIYYLTATGRKEKMLPTTCKCYPASSEYPEILAANPTPMIDYQDGKEVVTEEYKKNYPDANPREIRKIVSESFYKSLDSSKSKSSNPIAWEAAKRLTAEGLEERYGIKQEQPAEAPGIV